MAYLVNTLTPFFEDLFYFPVIYVITDANNHAAIENESQSPVDSFLSLNLKIFQKKDPPEGGKYLLTDSLASCHLR